MNKIGWKKAVNACGLLVVVYLLYVIAGGILSVTLRTPPEPVERALTFKETSEQVTLLEYGLASFGARMNIIEEAEETLDVAYFYMEQGESVQLHYAYVLAAADRGVNVRYLLDGLFHGVRGDDRDVLRAFNAHPNIELKLYEPVWSVVLAPWRVNNRMHDKILIADDQFAVTGGRNIGDLYYERGNVESSYSFDRDIMLINQEGQEDGLISDMQAYYTELFDSDYSQSQNNRTLFSWEQTRAEEKLEALRAVYEEHQHEEADREQVAQITDWIDQSVEINGGFHTHNSIERGFKQPYIWSDLLTLANQAEEELFVQSPWVIPNRHMRQHLEAVDLSVGQAKVLTNGKSTNSNIFAQAGTENRKDFFIESFADYYEFQPKGSSLHMKTLVVDNQISAVGAYNFDARSTWLSTESMLVIDSEELAEQIMNEAEASYLNRSVRFDPSVDKVPGEHTEVKEAALWERLLVPVMRPFAWVLESLL
ncbi:phospholipase D-like domain-containing protein [Alkalibacterium sp. AK22]|uniref:phospholipase D-like domain-containing protein n=1 Tax=Alkalibacterium sp. AK22 TaxID=1229520 RepID=UPI0018CC15B4|nr:phospholipase D family protein [Alkalibacterium sp. AK22]